jgi:hypothetical protein
MEEASLIRRKQYLFSIEQNQCCLIANLGLLSDPRRDVSGCEPILPDKIRIGKVLSGSREPPALLK